MDFVFNEPKNSIFRGNHVEKREERIEFELMRVGKLRRGFRILRETFRGQVEN